MGTPFGALEIGDRVRLTRTHHALNEVIGTVQQPVTTIHGDEAVTTEDGTWFAGDGWTAHRK